MSKIKKLLALVMALAMVLSLAACGGSDSTSDTSTDDTTTEDSTDDTEEAADTEEAEDTAEETSGEATASGDVISLTVWGAEEDQTLLAELVAGFEEAYADYATFDIQIGVESESTAKDTILTDI
ncbi:MAG: hypothetical protein LUH16_01745, partial [Clostridiales bacterium]|nr:hypothetical protein [Clostridiales bacterium]